MTGVAGRQSPELIQPTLTSRHVLAIALPITLSNATTPLVGFVDTAVIGQLGEAHLIGGVAVAANVFSLLFWAFGFLRMGTTGLTAQAVGSGDHAEVAAHLARPLVIALAAGMTLIGLQWPLSSMAFALVAASAEVTAEAQAYFTARIWSAPAALMNYALLGWFIGQSRADVAFALQLVLNGTNIALSALFVLVFGWGVTGVAAAVVVAEIIALALGFGVAAKRLQRTAPGWRLASVFEPAAVLRVLSVNADIMIRTLCLLSIFFIMTASAARSGDVTLAANALLLALTAVTVYVIDGFAYAAETLVGQSVGARDRSRFLRAAALSTIWAAGVSLVLTVALMAGGEIALTAMTPDASVQAAAREYLPWAALVPIIGIWCFQLDGIFIGATQTRAMRNMMILSLAVFLIAWWSLSEPFGNHGLWAALLISYVARAVFLGVSLPDLINRVFPGPSKAAR